MLAIKGLNQFYSGSHTLWDVDLSVPDGSLVCLMGRKGARFFLISPLKRT